MTIDTYFHANGVKPEGLRASSIWTASDSGLSNLSYRLEVEKLTGFMRNTVERRLRELAELIKDWKTQQ